MHLTKKRATNLIAVMNYSQAFGQAPPKRPFDLLRKYPTDLILLRLAKINAILYLQQEVLIQNMRVLKEAIFDGLPEVNDITVQLMALIDRAHQSAFTGPVMSLIIKEALENYTPGETMNSKEFAADLFKAILAYNEYFYTSKADPETFEGLFRQDIQQQYYLRRERFLKFNTLLKFAFLSKFLTDDARLKEPASEYCKALEIPNVWSLASVLLNLIERILINNKQAKYILERNGQYLPVLEQFVLRKEDLVEGRPLSLHYDLVPKPYYELDSERLLILDNNYFTYGLDQGVLFSLYKNTSLRDGKYNDLKSYFGLHFFERYFVGRFINTIFSDRNHRIVSNEKYQDYHVKAGNNVFVIEVKMTDFNANGLDRASFPDFQDFIGQNFLGAKKGLNQIIRQLGYLANDQELKTLLAFKDVKKINIYPIIVYSDANLDMNGVNEYVNEKAADLLRPFNTRPLIMINGSFFMTYYYLLRKDPAFFAQCLNDYLKSVNNLKRRFQIDKSPFNYSQYNKSFATHMRRKIPRADMKLNLDAIAANFDIEVKNFGEDLS
ncbi:hypothetical protein ACFGVS_03155 [Mucilaginibacter sp. AW1-7]|uniref:hypothetical protein n=1 Tax=Mucilaginibacter sp. AW1-7 TaxID=3349874 RepID=UPI003F732094